MEKIFVIGSNKTGTSSLAIALNTLGYNVCPEVCYASGSPILKDFQMGRYDDIFNLVNSYDVFEDRPWNHTNFYEILDAKFPESKFILTNRNVDTWVSSVKRWGNRIGTLNPSFYNIVSQTCYGVDDYLSNEEIMREKYLQRNSDIMEYFKDKNNLLVMDLEKKDGWKQLCPFLDKEILNGAFPHVNKN